MNCYTLIIDSSMFFCNHNLVVVVSILITMLPVVAQRKDP